jgi:hypothetical protein
MVKKKITFLFAGVFIFALSINAQWMWDINALSEIKKELKSPTYTDAYKELIKEAEKALKNGTYSVTFKKGIAPNGDNHEYVSLSRYFWPDSTKKDGLPYISKDGQSNPELEHYDRNPLGDMASSVTTLSLAYYYSGNERYAKKAVELLRVWFLNKATRMNPNLDYAQFIPGVDNNKGRNAGLIDSYSFVNMLNAVKLLEKSKNYTPADREELKKWFADFAVWWQTAKQALSEKNSKNNHGTAYDVQLATYALFAGDNKTALEIINAFPKKRLFPQIESDGSQPQELRRTLAFHYSVYNIQFMIDMCAIAKSQGIDMYNRQSTDGRAVYKAVDFLTPYLGKDLSAWHYQQISGWEEALQFFCNQLYRVTNLDPSRKDYKELYEKYSKQVSTDRNRLLYGVL